MATRILVCGGRNFNDTTHLHKTLDDILAHYGELVMISGGAPGADYQAHGWAASRGVYSATMPAYWGTQGKKAGVLRNRAMLQLSQPQLVVGFKGGPGTADMLRQARAAGIPTYEV